MQTGVITADNFSQVLRPISQRRQSGELEITSGDDVTRIVFDRGKIVEIQKSDSSNCELVLERLAQAGLMQYHEADAPTNYRDALEIFRSATTMENGRVDEIFELALHELMYDHLYSFRPYVGALYNFKMRGLEIDTALLPSLPVNQYLLELPEVEEMRKEAERYEDDNPYEVVKLASEGSDEVRGEYSIRIAEALGAGGAVLFDDLKLRSLLSEYHFWKGFHNLVESQNVLAAEESDLSSSEDSDVQVEPEEDSQAPDASEGEDNAADMLAFLENAIDESFEVDPITASDLEASQKEAVSDVPLKEGAKPQPVAPGAVPQKTQEPQHHEGLNRRLLHAESIPHIVNFLVFAAVIVSFFLSWKNFFIFLGRA